MLLLVTLPDVEVDIAFFRVDLPDRSPGAAFVAACTTACSAATAHDERRSGHVYDTCVEQLIIRVAAELAEPTHEAEFHSLGHRHG